MFFFLPLCTPSTIARQLPDPFVMKKAGLFFVLDAAFVPCDGTVCIQRRFKSALKAAGVNDINFHALRHTFATNCIARGCDPATLARILGHSDVSVTLNTYVHPSFEAMSEIIDKVYSSAE